MGSLTRRGTATVSQPAAVRTSRKLAASGLRGGEGRAARQRGSARCRLAPAEAFRSTKARSRRNGGGHHACSWYVGSLPQTPDDTNTNPQPPGEPPATSIIGDIVGNDAQSPHQSSHSTASSGRRPALAVIFPRFHDAAAIPMKPASYSPHNPMVYNETRSLQMSCSRGSVICPADAPPATECHRRR